MATPNAIKIAAGNRVCWASSRWTQKDLAQKEWLDECDCDECDCDECDCDECDCIERYQWFRKSFMDGRGVDGLRLRIAGRSREHRRKGTVMPQTKRSAAFY